MKAPLELPEWGNWLAQDAGGDWWVYEIEPQEYHQGWYENELGRHEKVAAGFANPEWRKTLGRVDGNS
ncbi:hypothetical protein MNBD_GAMMA15-936 [hydrothermal vent metagenome]|uniref:Uncharacterized protein n=1 Tax=hydrothermal vent metagenome TaxID=652676 RepID=A0A3B0YG51_9ZZZZ